MSRYFWPCSMIKQSKLQISLYSKKHCIYIFAKLQGREVSEDFHWAAGERVFNPNKNDIFEICFFWGGGERGRSIWPIWVTFQQGKGKWQKIEKLLMIVNIGRENCHILWTTWAISMNFLRKMWLMNYKKSSIYLSIYLSTASSNNVSFIVL